MDLGEIRMAMSSKNHTIAPHLNVIPNKFELARVVMLRTRQLIGGYRMDKRVDKALKPARGQELPNSRAPKVALDEILLGSIKHTRNGIKSVDHLLDTDIVFTAI